MELPCVVPSSVIRIWPIHRPTSRGMILHPSISTVGVLTVCYIVQAFCLMQGRIYLVEKM